MKEPKRPRIVVLMYMQRLVQIQPAMVHTGGIVQVGQPKSCCQEQHCIGYCDDEDGQRLQEIFNNECFIMAHSSLAIYKHKDSYCSSIVSSDRAVTVLTWSGSGSFAALISTDR